MLKSWGQGGGANGQVIRGLAPRAWYRLGQGITTATGVSQWTDQSGNGNHLLQATGSAQPALQADGSIIFDGVAQFLKASFTFAGPQSIYLLAKQITWTADDVVIDGVNDISMLVQQRSGAASPVCHMRNTSGTGSANGNWPANTYAVLACVFGATTMSFRVNNTAAVTDAFAAVASGGITLGSRGFASGQFANIQVKELIAFPVEHSSAQQDQVVSYLSGVGGL